MIEQAREAVNGNVPLFIELVICLALLVMVAMFYAGKSDLVRRTLKWAGVAVIYFTVAGGASLYLLFVH